MLHLCVILYLSNGLNGNKKFAKSCYFSKFKRVFKVFSIVLSFQLYISKIILSK